MTNNTLLGVLVALSLAACGGGDRGEPAQARGLARGLAAQAEAGVEANADANADALLDWAEASAYGPPFFWSHGATQSAGPFRFRYYARTGSYLGVVVGSDPTWRLDGVYVMGGAFGDQPLYVGQRADFFTPPPDPTPGGAVRFSPATLAVNLDEGIGNTGIELVATPQAAFSGLLYVVVEDPARVLAGVDPVVIDTQGRAVTRVRPRDDLPLGLHQGTLQVHLCSHPTCSAEYAGSPVALPYRIGVVRNDPGLAFSAVNGVLSTTLAGGSSGRLTVSANASRWPADPMHWRALDVQGFVGGSGVMASTGEGIARSIDLQVTLPAAAGRYDGSVLVQGCRDSACTMPVDQQRFDYILFRAVSGLSDAALGAVPKLTPLQALPGAGDWSGWQGGPAHQGHVPGSFDPAAFSLRWQWALPPGKSYELAAPAVAQRRVALAAQGFGGSADTELFVLDEADGSLRWRLAGDFAAQSYFSTPALSATQLYSVVIGPDVALGSIATTLMAFDLQTGARRFATALGTQFHDALPPVLAGQRVLMASGFGNGLAALDAASGTVMWRAASTGFTWWTPAFDGSTVFSYGSGGFTAHDAADGRTLFSQTDNDLANALGGGPLTRSFAVDGGKAFVIDHGDLAAFDTRSGLVAWRQATHDHVGTTAAQAGTVVALRQGPLRVEARSAVDGHLLWSTQPVFDVTQGADQAFVSEPLLTDNLVFVSTERGVYAFSRSDGRALWYWGRPGRLALSAQGVLSIAHPGAGGGVTAINLR